MADSIFEIGADGVDVEALVADIQKTVADKMKRGVYADACVARAERANLANLKDDREFLEFYLRCLRQATFVDTNDFAIRERRKYLGPVLIPLKKLIWKLLKFYTFRVWSQQNQVNGLLVTAIESLDEQYHERIGKLEKRIKMLETQVAELTRKQDPTGEDTP